MYRHKKISNRKNYLDKALFRNLLLVEQKQSTIITFSLAHYILIVQVSSYSGQAVLDSHWPNALSNQHQFR